MDIVEKIRNVILNRRSEFQNEIVKIGEKISNLELKGEFVNKYNSNNVVDFELLKKFYDELNTGVSIEYYERVVKSLNYFVDNNLNNIFQSDIMTCNSTINELVLLVSEVYKNEMSKLDRDRSGILNKSIKDFSRCLEILDGYASNNYLSSDEYDYICSFFSDKLDVFDGKDVVELMTTVTKANSKQMDLAIKRALIEGNKKKREVNGNRDAVNRDTVEEEVIERDNFDVAVDSSLEIGNYDLSDEQRELLSRAINIIKADVKVSDNIEIAFSSLDSDMGIDDRIFIYNSLSNSEDMRNLIILDMTKNIIPRLDYLLKNNNMNVLDEFKGLEKIIYFYDHLDEVKEKSYVDILRDSNQLDKVAFCGKVDELLTKCDELKNINEKLYYTHIYSLFQQLLTTKNDFVEWIDSYYLSDDDDVRECIDNIYQNMRDLYRNLSSQYERAMEDVFPKNDIYMDNAMDFYQTDNLKNIYVLLGGGQYSSNIESDIESNKNFNIREYENVLNKLKERTTSDFVANGDSKVKSDDYTDDFLKKYHVKCINNGDSVIFYSRFGTTLEQLNGKKISVVFIYSVGYRKNYNDKSDIYADALRRCYESRDEIDYYVKLLNTDFIAISDDRERNRVLKEVNDYINSQKLKMGHFIEVCDEKKKIYNRGKEVS